MHIHNHTHIFKPNPELELAEALDGSVRNYLAKSEWKCSVYKMQMWLVKPGLHGVDMTTQIAQDSVTKAHQENFPFLKQTRPISLIVFFSHSEKKKHPNKNRARAWQKSVGVSKHSSKLLGTHPT